MANKSKRPTSFHWGSYYAEIEDEKIVASATATSKLV